MPLTSPETLSTLSLPWHNDAAEHWFSALSHLPWAMLLHSGHAEHASSRFDILTAEPRATLQTRDGRTQVKYASGEVHTYTGCPLKRLAQVMAEQNITAAQSDDYPFQGGALGLFGYDLGRSIETLPTLAKADITVPDMAVGIYDWALIIDNKQQRITLLSHTDAQARLDWLRSLPRLRRAPLRLV